jgi:hypothetical protein
LFKSPCTLKGAEKRIVAWSVTIKLEVNLCLPGPVSRTLLRLARLQKSIEDSVGLGGSKPGSKIPGVDRCGGEPIYGGARRRQDCVAEKRRQRLENNKLGLEIKMSGWVC